MAHITAADGMHPRRKPDGLYRIGRDFRTLPGIGVGCRARRIGVVGINELHAVQVYEGFGSRVGIRLKVEFVLPCNGNGKVCLLYTSISKL